MLDLLLCISRLIVLRILNSLLSRKFLEKGEKNSDFFSFLFLCELIISLDIVFYLDIKAPQVKSLFFEDIKMEKCIRCQSPEVKKN